MFKLPIFSKNKNDSNKFLALSLNSNVVRCLAFYQDDKNTRILGYGYELMEPGSFRGGIPVDIQSVGLSVEKAINKAIENIEEKVFNVIIGTSGTLCIDTMTTVRVKRSKTPITHKELETTFNKIADISAIQAQNQYAEITGNIDTQLELITSSTVYSKLDGNMTQELEKKTGALVEIAVFNSHAPSFYLDAIKNLSKSTGLKILAICSNMYTLVKALTLSSEELNDFVLIEVSEDTTNVSVIFGKGILSTRSLDIGTNHFVEGISQEMGLTMRDSQKILNGYISKSLAQSESIIVQKCLQNTLEIWLSGLELLFTEFAGVKMFASKVLLSGLGADIPDLWDLIKNEPWTKNIPFRAPPHFEKVSFLDFGKITDATGKVTNSEWITTACLSVAYLEIKGLIND